MLLSVNGEDLDRTGWSWTRTKRQATPHVEAAASTTVLSLTHCGDTRLAGSWLALSHVYKRRNKLHPSDECCCYPHGAGLGLTFSLACYGYDWAGLVEPNVVCCVPHSEGCNQYFIWSFKPTSWQHQTTIIGGFMLVREAMAFYWLQTECSPFSSDLELAIFHFLSAKRIKVQVSNQTKSKLICVASCPVVCLA